MKNELINDIEELLESIIEILDTYNMASEADKPFIKKIIKAKLHKMIEHNITNEKLASFASNFFENLLKNPEKGSRLVKKMKNNAPFLSDMIISNSLK